MLTMVSTHKLVMSWRVWTVRAGGRLTPDHERHWARGLQPYDQTLPRHLPGAGKNVGWSVLGGGAWYNYSGVFLPDWLCSATNTTSCPSVSLTATTLLHNCLMPQTSIKTFRNWASIKERFHFSKNKKDVLWREWSNRQIRFVRGFAVAGMSLQQYLYLFQMLQWTAEKSAKR